MTVVPNVLQIRFFKALQGYPRFIVSSLYSSVKCVSHASGGSQLSKCISLLLGFIRVYAPKYILLPVLSQIPME